MKTAKQSWEKRRTGESVPSRSRRPLSIATQFLLFQLAIVTVVIAIASYVSLNQSRRQIDRLYAQRALSIAKTVASVPAVRDAFSVKNPSGVIQPIAEAARIASGADFVVVADRNQIRLSHPDPSKIGQRLSTDAGPALRGFDWTGIEVGTLGRSVRGKTPIRDVNANVIGIVSVGILTESPSKTFGGYLRELLFFVGIASAIGAVASFAVARRLRRQTFSLDGAAIADLLENREAMLHGIREGVIAFDLHERVSLLNDEAGRLLDLPVESVGRNLNQLTLSPRVLDVFRGLEADRDAIVLHANRVLTLNQMPIVIDERRLGTVVTLRDRTEIETLEAELQGAKNTTDALRAQAHEFSNRLHTVSGLIALGAYDEAASYVAGAARAQEALADAVSERVDEPMLAALLIAKSVSAREHNAELIINPETTVTNGDVDDANDAILVVGNLIDNALQALGGQEGWVEVKLVSDREQLRIEVRDSGPGIAPELAREIFDYGFTTKAATIGGRRGLGLALSRQACVRRGGSIDLHNDGGAVFTAVIPSGRNGRAGSGEVRRMVTQ